MINSSQAFLYEKDGIVSIIWLQGDILLQITTTEGPNEAIETTEEYASFVDKTPHSVQNADFGMLL